MLISVIRKSENNTSKAEAFDFDIFINLIFKTSVNLLRASKIFLFQVNWKQLFLILFYRSSSEIKSKNSGWILIHLVYFKTTKNKKLTTQSTTWVWPEKHLGQNFHY